MKIMARTKKQTLENATERKRQIQEEILKETEAKKSKEELSTHSKEQLNCAKSKTIKNMKINSSNCAVKEDLICNGSHSTNSSPIKSGEDLPKAVIFISDICRNQIKTCGSQEELCDSSSKDTQTQGVATSTGAADKSGSPEVLKGSPKSPRYSGNKKNAHNASLETLKAVSEKVREEKSRKAKTFQGLFNGESNISWPSMPSLDSDSHVSPETSHVEDPAPSADDKLKVNIFTENLGVDLGKRVRSPRRISEDMIALPIFSARKWSASPKEVSHLGKPNEDCSDDDLRPSKNDHQSDSFKSPQIVCPDSNRKIYPKASSSTLASFHAENPGVKTINGLDDDRTKVTAPCHQSGDADLEKCKSTKGSNGLNHDKNPVQNKTKGNEPCKEVGRSLLCAMLIGGTEVADHYTQDRVRYRSHTSESSDVDGVIASQCSNSNKTAHNALNTLNKEQKSKKVISSNEGNTVKKKDNVSFLDRDNDNNEPKRITSDSKSEVKYKTINFSSRLKMLNEDVLKLLDIDTAADFLEADSSTAVITEDNGSSPEEKELLRDVEKGLYRLINSLGARLSNTSEVMPDSTPVDKELVRQLIQSCPKTSHCIASKSDSMSRLELLQKRLKEKLGKDENKLSEPREDDVEKTLEPVNMLSNSNSIASVSPTASSNSASPRLRLSDSLSELDVDAITLAATSAVHNETDSSGPSSPKDKPDIDPEKNLDKPDNAKPLTKSEVPDICRNDSSSPVGSFKQSSSSSLNCSKSFSVISTINCNKENQIKSKLGSKIPVPGTSHAYRSSKRTWRLPRTVLEPKPLSILSEVEESSVEPKNIFTCPNLQKYLSTPSNRMIVPTDKREEMQAADAKAKEEEEIMQKIETQEVKHEESHTFQHGDPDFDEVDGVLFISFSNETELKAHLQVEKLLDWEKDDTMLRICRARAFEEAKSNNEDMRQFKLKQLRGQHMRWKKYRKLFSDEVDRLLGKKVDDEPETETLDVSRKTSDRTKIKGWRKRLSNGKRKVSDEGAHTFNGMPHLENSFEYEQNQKLLLNENISPAFSHKHLFRALHMDKEDCMIHLKLGGWSPRGTLSKPLSRMSVDRLDNSMDSSFDSSFQRDIKKEILPDSYNSGDNLIDSMEFAETMDSKNFLSNCNKKSIRRQDNQVIYPVLTETMAIDALNALQLQDIQGCTRKRSNRSRSNRKRKRTSLESRVARKRPESNNHTSSLKHGAPAVRSSPASSGSSVPTAVSAPTMPLLRDFKEEPVTEGVDITADGVSSPSIADTSSLKSCSKPGCRYGCICHLCSVGDVNAPALSPKSKSVTAYCEKEYCRLGCICDTIDSEKPKPSSYLSGRRSSLLHLSQHELGLPDDINDIPYLPSYRKRPKPGERFSNLPQRERTHRASKNLDAITRKAMMLYETSEIYCKKVERIRKKPENLSSPTVLPSVSSSLQSSPSDSEHKSFSSNSKDEFEICTEYAEEDDSFASFPESICKTETLDSMDTSTPVMQQKPIPRFSQSIVDVDDIIKIIPVMEPSAHKRKRKSHPLSNEIFTSSTCARAQPFKSQLLVKDKIWARKSIDCLHANPSSKFVDINSGFEPNKTDCDNLQKDTDHVTFSEYAKAPSESAPSSSGVPSVSPIGGITSENISIISKAPLTKSASAITKVSSDALMENSLNKNVESNLAARKSGKNPKQLENSIPNETATLKQQTSPQGALVNSGSLFGAPKQHHGWHTSMVCLKARAPPKLQNLSEDDIQEEDEVKLLEFAANCNWEGAKKEILGKVAQCLTRGQYPQPRTMNVCEFVVEILPKAQQPSLIPPELRSKLPDQMFSIRVRITRREQMANDVDIEQPVIDLSDSSPVKRNGQGKQQQSLLNTSLTEPTTSSSIGISGLSKLCISNPPISLSKPDSNVTYRPVGFILQASNAPTNLETTTSKSKSLLGNTIVLSKQDPFSLTSSGTQTLVKPKGLVMIPGSVDASSSTQVPSSQGLKCPANKTQLLVSQSNFKHMKLPKKPGSIVEVIVEPPIGKQIISVPIAKGKMAKGNQRSLLSVPITHVLPQSSLKGKSSLQSGQKPNTSRGKGTSSAVSHESKKESTPSPLSKLEGCKEEQTILVFEATHLKSSNESLLVKQENMADDLDKVAAKVSPAGFTPIVKLENKQWQHMSETKTQKPINNNDDPRTSAPHGTDADSIPNILPAGIKEQIPSQPADVSQQCERRRLSAGDSITLNEDSNVSAHSDSYIHTRSSPAGLVDRPKSVMSTSISTASTDDILIMLSSDEEIDVCDTGVPEEIQKEENCQPFVAQTYLLIQETAPVKKESKNFSTTRLTRHNHLERMRRSKLKALFEDLQVEVFKENGLPEDHVMSKANVLIEARKVILKLCKEVKKGDSQRRMYQKRNHELKLALRILQTDMSKKEKVPTDEPVLPVSDSSSLQPGQDKVDKDDCVDLVSSSSEDQADENLSDHDME
ncbi:uncharacterized protein LOC106054710 isoform X1 [Biomphalaria glabrata]|uniref:Uncharacterized protein LOC106054710 isoform X1 n=1 Tax=Biomphalaria glabrata TaxID=6526 RepID=A0A9U8DY33_BIOGL|nr:uncharacterized protein LOC106054710 isoform X1 [Biomphalaria glabrata]